MGFKSNRSKLRSSSGIWEALGMKLQRAEGTQASHETHRIHFFLCSYTVTPPPATQRYHPTSQ